MKPRHDLAPTVSLPQALGGLLGLMLLSTCSTTGPAQRKAGVLDFLYPEGSEAIPPKDVQLELPARVGIAFVPETESGMAAPLDATERQRLLERVTRAFKDTEGVERIEIIPPSYLTEGGGFANLDQLRPMFGVDLIALLSYDQRQVEDVSNASFTYWTIVGAYVVQANLNDTHTFVDTSVFDIRSRALLFNAAGRSRLEGRATAIQASQEMRAKSIEGFEMAVDNMIAQLEVALSAFREQVKTGSVRGAGTPAITVAGASGSAGGTGAGAGGAVELGFALALGLTALAGRGGTRDRRTALGQRARA